MTYYVVRKTGAIGQGTAVVTKLTPAWEALAAFTAVSELQRYLLTQTSNPMTLAYQGRFERRPRARYEPKHSNRVSADPSESALTRLGPKEHARTMKLKTTIEQVTGFHNDGTPYVALKEIVTHASDYTCDPNDPDDLPDADWLEKQHAAWVALESIRDPAHRARALEWARGVEADDLPRMVERIIAETEEKKMRR